MWCGWRICHSVASSSPHTPTNMHRDRHPDISPLPANATDSFICNPHRGCDLQQWHQRREGPRGEMCPHSRPEVGLVFPESRIPARARRPSHRGRHVRATGQLRKGLGHRSRPPKPWGRAVAASEAGISYACKPSSAAATHQGMEATAAAGKTIATMNYY